jgi:hypothetical protein
VRRLLGNLAIVAVLAGGSAIGLYGQSTGAPDAGLLAEVKGLRTDLNQLMGAGVRMQLLVARLSLQEQRITVVGRQLIDVQTQLSTAMRERSDAESKIARFEAEIRGNLLSADELKAVQGALVGEQKITLPARLQKEQQLRAQESELLTDLATEQSRWTDFNNRLDELERSLPLAAPGR